MSLSLSNLTRRVYKPCPYKNTILNRISRGFVSLTNTGDGIILTYQLQLEKARARNLDGDSAPLKSLKQISLAGLKPGKGLQALSWLNGQPRIRR